MLVLRCWLSLAVGPWAIATPIDNPRGAAQSFGGLPIEYDNSTVLRDEAMIALLNRYTPVIMLSYVAVCLLPLLDSRREELTPCSSITNRSLEDYYPSSIEYMLPHIGYVSPS